MSPPTLLIATTNAGKSREFGALLADVPVVLQTLADRPGAPIVDEDGASYEANALLKARAIAAWAGCATLADDSGLEVDALGGAPGVHSARYADGGGDAANIAKLVRALSGVPAARRSARFRCVIVVACPDGATLRAEGTCEGLILDTPRGRGGFGYDPVFFVPELDRTMAELAAADKNRISHRARACERLRADLLPFLAVHGSGAPPSGA